MILSARFFAAVLITIISLFTGSLILQASEPVIITEEVQLKLGDAFLEQGEYYRAITEFKKALILFPDSHRADYATFAVGLCHFRGEQYDKAQEAFHSFRTIYPESRLIQSAMYLEGLSCLKRGRYPSAQLLFTVLTEEDPDSEYAPRAFIALSLVALEQGRIADSVHYLQHFLDRYPFDENCAQVNKTIGLLAEYADIPRKSPAVAAIMSAVIPGAGYVYANHAGDGAMAFLVNGLFACAEIASLHAENYALAAIVGGVGVPFYLGNIWGSANAARKRNDSMERRLREEIAQTLSFVYEGEVRK